MTGRSRAARLACLATMLGIMAVSGSAQGLSVYISVDMEGIGGVVSDAQLGPGGFEYQRFREFMTEEALAAVEGAKEAGATRILVSDSHGNGQNLLIDRFPPDVRIIRSWSRRFAMMAGIDESFDAVLFIGYHASTNNSEGVRAHTFSSANLSRVALNGQEVTEGAWNAAIAGEFGVPVVMISGDDAAVREVRSLVGPIEAAEVKTSLGFHSANVMTPSASRALIKEKVIAALRRLDDFRPYTVSSPVTLDISFKNYRPAEVLSYLKGVERVDAHSIRFVGQNMKEISDFRVVVTGYSPDLEP